MMPALSLVVILVVDQLRTDELFRAKHLLKPNGIAKILKEGVNYEDAHQANFFNMTCVGHSSISTGAPPQLTNIILNTDYDPSLRKGVYCVDDSKNHWIEADSDQNSPEMGTSAERLKVTTIGDEMKLLWGSQTRVIAVAEKDRASILLAGHLADAAYFYAPRSRKWTTSTAYNKALTLPDWVKKFNERFKNRKTTSIDYHISAESPMDTTALALEAVKAEKLGKHVKPDLLAVSFSAHDFVGHQFGDDSPELEKMIQVEDTAIAQLMAGLQKELGPKFRDTLFVFTADHGAGPNMKHVPSNLPAGKILRSDIEKTLSDCLKPEGIERPVVFTLSSAVYLSESVTGKPGLVQKAKDCLEAQPSMLRVLTRSEIQSGHYPEQTHWGHLLSLTFPGKGGPDLVGVLKPYWGTSPEATGHETPHSYDSWVPLALWSPRLKGETVYRNVEVTSLAPTLARLLETRRPSGTQAPYLTEVLERFK